MSSHRLRTAHFFVLLMLGLAAFGPGSPASAVVANPADHCLDDPSAPDCVDAPDTFDDTDIAERWAEASDRELLTAMQAQLLTEIDVLTHLGAFGDNPEQFELIAKRYGAQNPARFELLRQLPLIDRAGALLLAELGSRDVDKSNAVTATLAVMPLSDFRELQDGKTGTVESSTYMTAMSDALYRDGRASSTGAAALPVEEIEALLDSLGLSPAVVESAQAAQPIPAPTRTAAPTPTPEPPAELAFETLPDEAAPSGAGSTTTLLAVGAGAVVAAGSLGAGVKRRNGTRSVSGNTATTPAPATPANTDAARPSAPGVTALLDASRRMTRSFERNEIAGIAVEEAMALLNAEGGAFLALNDNGLELLAESPGGLIVADGFAGSALARVAEAGQPTYAVTNSDPGLTTLPVALAAVPVIAGGGVTGVMLAVRSSTAPFDATSIEHLGMLAPMAGSAMAAASDHQSVAELAHIDGLTQLHNRRKLDHDLPAAVEHSAAAGTPMCFVMADVDHFKTYNDTHGHGAGDVALQLVAQVITSAVREADIVYRYGGEEFSILLPSTDISEAADVAERVRLAVEAAVFEGQEQQPNGNVTVSIGLAERNGDTPTGLRERADVALYAAKAAGRNRVQLAD